MSRALKIFRIALGASLLASLAAGCGKKASVDDVQPRLDAMVAEKFAAYKKDDGKLPAGAGILVHLVTPKGTWTAASGLPDGAGADSHYRIASVSKTLTAAAVMLLDQQGKLRLDDKIISSIPGTDIPYLPDSPNYDIPHKDEITIRDLLAHRARVFDVFNEPLSMEPYNGYPYSEYVKQTLNEPDHQFTCDEIVGVAAANDLAYDADQTKNGYKYSDTGYTILAKIIQRISLQSYDRFIADNLLKPLGLAQTTAPWSPYDSMPPEPFLPGYGRMRADEDFIEVSECNMSDQIGPGNIVSTPSDMARWFRAIFSGAGPLKKEQVARMTKMPEGNTSYALGIGHTDVGLAHTGAHPGYVNLAAYHPGDDVAVVVVTPFIDYSRLHEQLALITDVAKGARKIAGYETPWPPK